MDSDKRFSHISSDPKFRRIPKSEKKIKIDKRFQSMFKDKQFKVKYTTDKRGRPINHTSTEDLKRYYELSSSSESDSDSEDNTSSNNTAVEKYIHSPSENDKSKKNSQLKVKNELVSVKVKEKLKNLKVDYARGESKLLSESSSESETDSESDDSENVEHAWGELDRDADKTEEVTNRLAVCNMDWDRIRATDLMVLFNSFLPPGGVIESVTIYPSEYGIKRMQEEEVKGPIELVEKNQNEDEIEQEDTSEGSKYHMEKLRQYQLNRLKYYYAVVVCDTVNTANKIYTECDGLEYESSATKIDLRFIPNDMNFDQEPKEICNKLPDQGKYQPRFFTTTALQQAKVDLTWDETDPNRIEITKKLAEGTTDLVDGDLQAYLASSSGEEISEDENNQEKEIEDSELGDLNPLDKYKALLQEIEKKEEEKANKDVQMEVSWGLDIKEKTAKLVKEKLSQKEEKTPFEQYLEKRTEKRKQKKEKAKQANLSGSDDDSDSVDVDMSDPYFAEEFQNGDFKTKSKKKKIKSNDSDSEQMNEEKKAELELLLLDEESDKKHFSMKKILEADSSSKKKRKNKRKLQDEEHTEQDHFQINVNDDRFSALYTSHHFNLDPTDPHFKRTKGMEMLVEEKLKRRNNTSVELNTESKEPKTDSRLGTELKMLVKSVKQKTNFIKSKNNAKIK